MTARRVIVALDASARSPEAARAAAALARGLGLDLAGLFVEDENLLRLSGLPFAHHLPVSGGPARPLDRQVMEAQLRGLAAAARAEVERAATSVHVHWSFEVRRGPLPAEALDAAGGTDLLLLGARIAELAREVLAGELIEPALIGGHAWPRRAAAVLAVVDQAGGPEERVARLLGELGLPILRVRRKGP